MSTLITKHYHVCIYVYTLHIKTYVGSTMLVVFGVLT